MNNHWLYVLHCCHALICRPRVRALTVVLAVLLNLSWAPFALPLPDVKAQEGAPPGPDVSRAALLVQRAPRPHFKTSGAIGQPASFRAPQKLETVHAAMVQSTNDWNPDLQDGFESGLGQAWLTMDQSADGFDRSWGLDDFYVNSGAYALWVSAGGSDALDPELNYYPPNLDAWLVTNGYFDLSRVQAADVEFQMYLDTEAEYDWIFVGASIDGENYSGEYWTGLSGGWQYYNLDLSEYAGYPQVSLAWYFHSDESNADGEHEGVWLDDITVWTYVESGPVQGAESIQNGDFETADLSGWTVPAGSTVTALQTQNPQTGNYVAFFGGIPNAEESFHQPVALPAGDVSGAHLGWWVNLFGEEIEIGADLFCAGIFNSDLSALLLDLGCLDGAEVTSSAFDAAGWWQVDIDLSGAQWSLIQGQTVNFVFQMFTDEANNTSVLIDDVTLEVITGGVAGDALEPNDSPQAATAVAPGTPFLDLTIAPDQDYDYFKVAANAGETIVVDVDAAVNGSVLDAYAQVLDTAGQVICENDDDANSFDSYLACPVAAAGEYYVVIGSYDGSGDRSYVYTLAISVAAGGAPPPEPPPTTTPEPPPSPNPRRTWTAILYIDGDNNLCRFYPNLITRMENELGAKIGPGGFLNIAVLIDLDPRYCNGNGATTRYLIQPGATYTANVNRWEMGELNMGDPQTLVNFATWAMDNYPADHYYLAIDDHGGGTTGIAWDDTNGGDNIENAQLYAALKEITQNGARKLEVFAFEACLMALYENVYDLRHFTNYVFGFPTISMANDASYPSYLGDARFTANANGRTLGDIMFDVYYAAVTDPYVVALVDTSKLDALHGAVNGWASVLQNQLGTAAGLIAAGRTAAQKVEANGDNEITDADPYLDLWDLADKLAAQGIGAAEATALKSAVEAAVVRLAYRPADAQTPWDYADAHGLTIFWPKTTSGSYAAYVSDQIYNSTRDGQWDEFLRSYFGLNSSGGRGGMQTSVGAVERLAATPTTPTIPSVFLPLLQR
jgi:hypothetical protein